MNCDIGTAEVASDLVELGRDAEAIALLDAELPGRHANPCGACGQPSGYSCREQVTRPCKACDATGVRAFVQLPGRLGAAAVRGIGPCQDCGGRKEREVFVDKIVPCFSRILGVKRPW